MRERLEGSEGVNQMGILFGGRAFHVKETASVKGLR